MAISTGRCGYKPLSDALVVVVVFNASERDHVVHDDQANADDAQVVPRGSRIM
jgi:hypothetical protein